MVEYVRGKSSVTQSLPNEIQNFIIIKQTGWTLKYIQSLNLRDYEIISCLSLIEDRFSRVQQENLINLQKQKRAI